MIQHIKGYQDLYEISSDGSVWSLNYNREHRKAKLVGQLDKDGYRVVLMRKNGVRKVLKVHRLVAQAFIPNPENKPQINHKNGIRYDNRVKNLEWATSRANVLHSFRILGKQNPRGSAHKLSKLTEKQVIEIYKLKGKGKTNDIIRKYGITQQNVSRIHTQKTWKWLTDTL